MKKVYRHKKGKAYVVLHIATDTETLQEIVVYRSLYGEGKVWCRPSGMFYEQGRFTAIQPHELTKEELDQLILMYQPGG